jgi:hypothetical protein
MSIYNSSRALGDAAVLAQLMCELGYETKRREMEARLQLILSKPGLQNLCRYYGWLRVRDDWHACISKLWA